MYIPQTDLSVGVLAAFLRSRWKVPRGGDAVRGRAQTMFLTMVSACQARHSAAEWAVATSNAEQKSMI